MNRPQEPAREATARGSMADEISAAPSADAVAQAAIARTTASAETRTAAASGHEATIAGTLHVFVAWDWGDEIDLEHAQRLVPAEAAGLSRRRRTPSSIRYRPAPLVFRLEPAEIELPGVGRVSPSLDVTVFDLAAVSATLRVSLELTPTEWTRLAGQLANVPSLWETVRQRAEPLYARLLPAIKRPGWGALREEYFVFQLTPGGTLPAPAALLTEQDAWLASLLRLEPEPMSREEVAEATRLRITYSPRDLFIAEWAAAVLVDQDCDETLQTIEFANVQLLELRELDNRLDDELAAVYDLIHPRPSRWLLPWRTHAKPLRVLGRLRVDAQELLDRTGNVLKLVGDQYLARVHRMLGQRFHLEAWGQNVRQALDVIEGAYHIVSDQATTSRSEAMELMIIALIAFEILMAFFRH